jgi:hypothetical protein
MWFKIDPHELAVFIALENEPMGDWEMDMYAAARRQGEAMLHRSTERGFGAPGANQDSEPQSERMDDRRRAVVSVARLRHRVPRN